jgi:hypothetical protein
MAGGTMTFKHKETNMASRAKMIDSAEATQPERAVEEGRGVIALNA